MRFKDSASTINFRVLLRIIGLLLIIEGAFLSVPLVTSLIYQERDWINFLFTMGLTLTAGSLMTFCIRPRSQRMAKREGFLLTALVWVFFSIFGMIPFMLMEKDPLSVSDAFFIVLIRQNMTGESELVCYDNF